MSVAQVWKRPPRAFLFPGWVSLVIGGTVMILLLFFILAMPFASDQFVSDADLPRDPSPAAAIAGKLPRFDLLASGEFLHGTLDPRRGAALHIHRDANWMAIRSCLERLREAGFEEIRIVVRSDAGGTNDLPFRLDEPWPELGVSAPAQDFVNAIR